MISKTNLERESLFGQGFCTPCSAHYAQQRDASAADPETKAGGCTFTYNSHTSNHEHVHAHAQTQHSQACTQPTALRTYLHHHASTQAARKPANKEESAKTHAHSSNTHPPKPTPTRTHAQARPFSPRQPISGHPGRVRVHYRAAKEDDLVPGQGAFRTRDELVHSSFSTAQVGASVSHVGMPMAGEVGEGAGVQRVCFLGLGTPSPCLLRVCNLDWMKVVHERIHMHTGCARALAKTSLESQAPQRMHTRRHAHRHTHMRARAHTGTHTCAHAHSRRHTHMHTYRRSL